MSEHVGISIIDWSGERVYITGVSVCLSMSTLVPVDAAMCLGPLSRHWSHLVWLGDYNLLTRCWECSHISPRTRTDKTVVMMRGGGKEEVKAPMKDVVKAAGIFKGNDFFQDFYPTAQLWILLNVKWSALYHSSYPLFSSDRWSAPSVGKLLCFTFIKKSTFSSLLPLLHKKVRNRTELQTQGCWNIHGLVWWNLHVKDPFSGVI